MIYLDYNASAPIDDEALKRMNDIWIYYPGNPDSRHPYGMECGRFIDDAVKTISGLFKNVRYRVVFTSGATEANNLAIQSAMCSCGDRKHFVTTTIEHKSVLELFHRFPPILGYKVDYVRPQSSGAVSVRDVLGAVDDDTYLVSVMHVNNETGVIQPIAEIGKELHRRKVLFHVDATQSMCKLMKQLDDAAPDMISFSAHKFGGPQGIGCLLVKDDIRIRPIFSGGSQQGGIRPGTVPVALIAGMSKACTSAIDSYNVFYKKYVRLIRDRIICLMDESGLPYSINGDPSLMIDNTLNIRFEGVNAGALLNMAKDLVCASTGSACNLGKSSYVLKEMGLTDEQIAESIRFSWGADSWKDFDERVFAMFIDCARKLRSI